MSLQVITVESVSGCEVVGIYLTEKLAKVALSDFVESGETAYKKKLVKKDNEEAKKLVYLEDSKETDKKSVYMTSVPFVLPVCGRAKKVKDPLAPKKSLSGFMLFSNDHRASIKESKPDATFGEVGRLVGEAWKSLDTKKKAAYTKLSEDGKKLYLSEMEAYTARSKPAPTPTPVPAPTPAPTPALTSESEPELGVGVAIKTKPRGKKMVVPEAI